jgi:hypothetical protein
MKMAEEPGTQRESAPKAIRPIFWVGGSKGGVGKSLVAMAVVDLLQRTGRSDMHLIDCDNSNPDVWKAYRDTVSAELVDLDSADGWIQLVNTCSEHVDKIIVINTAARNNGAVRQFGGTLDSTLEELKSTLVALWVINRQRDALELLRDFMGAMPTAHVHVVRNSYFGDEQKFELYNSSKVREVVEQRGGKSVTFPDLADRVVDDLYSKRLPIERAAASLPLGNRAELLRWRSAVQRAFADVLG